MRLFIYLLFTLVLLSFVGCGGNASSSNGTSQAIAKTSTFDQNETLLFDCLDPNSLFLSKLVFLTTSQSASASELVINAMEPYLQNNVTIVGKRTHGKPVGMAGRTNGSYIYFLVNFVIANSVGFYDYFSGLPADCSVEDQDFLHQLGDPNEALLSEALFYIDQNHCG